MASGSGSSSSSGDDSDGGGTARRSRAGRRPALRAAASAAKGSVAGGRDEAWVAEEAEAIDVAERRLAALKETIDAAALARDAAAAEQCAAAAAQLETQQAELAAAEESREALIDRRYGLLSAALAAINRHLSHTYRTLTAGIGDAALSYTSERRLLFAEGVVLRVRPDAKHWRPFGQLSGGQQALASLALSFALQARTPGCGLVLCFRLAVAVCAIVCTSARHLCGRCMMPGTIATAICMFAAFMRCTKLRRSQLAAGADCLNCRLLPRD